MNSIEKRITELETQNNHKRLSLEKLSWTKEQLAFRKDIHKRMEEAGTTFYHEVCNDEEFQRIKKQSSQASLIYFYKRMQDSKPV